MDMYVAIPRSCVLLLLATLPSLPSSMSGDKPRQDEVFLLPYFLGSQFTQVRVL